MTIEEILKQIEERAETKDEVSSLKHNEFVMEFSSDRLYMQKLLAVIRELVGQRDMWRENYMYPDEGYSGRDNDDLVKILVTV